MYKFDSDLHLSKSYEYVLFFIIIYFIHEKKHYCKLDGILFATLDPFVPS